MTPAEFEQILLQQNHTLTHTLNLAEGSNERKAAMAKVAGQLVSVALLFAAEAAEKSSTRVDDRIVRVARMMGLDQMVEELVLEQLQDG